MKRMGLEKVVSSDCLFPCPLPLPCVEPWHADWYVGTFRGGSFCAWLPGSTLTHPSTDVRYEQHQTRHWGPNEWDPISALQTGDRCEHLSFKGWNRCFCGGWEPGEENLYLVSIQGRRELSSWPRESAKVSKKWLNCVLRTGGVFLAEMEKGSEEGHSRKMDLVRPETLGASYCLKGQVRFCDEAGAVLWLHHSFLPCFKGP